MRTRRQNLLAAMRAASLDAVLLTSKVAIRYYTGFTSDECMALLTDKGCCLTTDFRYTIQAKAQCDDGVTVIEANTTLAQRDVIRAALTNEGCRSCGYEQDALSVAGYEALHGFPVRWEAFGDEISAPRRVKSAGEIACLAKAQAIADEAFAALLPKLHTGMTEREATAELNYLCMTLGSEEPAFDPVVAGGENGAMCHAVPGGRAFTDGDLAVFDFGCTVGGYRSDMTRTVGFGNVRDELRRVYAIVLTAQLRALDGVRAGVSGKAVDAIARDYIESQGYGAYFGHGLGHGFGLEIHEPPRASRMSDDVLVPGNTITVEPGIYLPGKGGVRIEDCVVVTADGCTNLVSTAKDLLII